MRSKLKIFVTIASIFLLFFTACDSSNDRNPIIADVFNEDLEYPNGIPLFLTILNLNEPALLTSKVENEDGTYSLSEELKEAIIFEQDQIIAELQAISPEIKIIFSYKLALNALAIEAPQEFADQISDLDIKSVEAESFFKAPILVSNQEETEQEETESEVDITSNNSVTYIKADKVHSELSTINSAGERVPVKGQGSKVGIIDSGIDYTHAALGGSGNKNDFENIDSKKLTSGFPNEKVKGGYDFVGSDFGANPHLYRSFVPVPDLNPIDRGGHGTHVAGTVAGQGDGVNTYDGVAPEADLYALKVFGDFGGGTGQTAVIAALEFAMDPNGDLDINDKLDVVNLSLGSSYGTIHSLYDIAVKNVTHGDLVVVASAGNDGPMPNIVSSPGIENDAISVAAVRDSMRHHIEFNAATFTFPDGREVLAEAVEGAITAPLEDSNSAQGKLVYVGDATVDFTDEQKTRLNGNVALIDRGVVSFVEKIERAVVAGATAVVMVNNSSEDPIVMGGEVDTPLSIPGVMISKAVGDQIKATLELQFGHPESRRPREQSVVTTNLKPNQKFLKEELIGTITDFSSQGPRSLDAAIKPEVSAPGMQIISARAGSGEEGVKLNGTSFSSPHVAGVAALIKQYQKNLNAKQVKSLLLNSTSLVLDEEGNRYPVSRQGAGLINAYEAVVKKASFWPPSISLGKINISRPEVITKQIQIKNHSSESLAYNLTALSDDSLQIDLSQEQIILSAGETENLELNFTISPTSEEVAEIDAFIQIFEEEKLIGNLPILAVINRKTAIKTDELRINSLGYSDSALKEVTAKLTNSGEHDGEALLFNLLGRDQRKPVPNTNESYKSQACDLQSAGYRIIKRQDPNASQNSDEEPQEVAFLQVAVKIFNPVSGWEQCLVTVDVDLNNDRISDKDMITITPSDVDGFEEDQRFRDLGVSNLVFDSEKVRQIENDYDEEVALQNEEGPERNYVLALESVNEVTAYRTSTVAMLELPVTLFGDAEDVRLRVSTIDNRGSSIEREDLLGDEGEEWRVISTDVENAGYFNLPESVSVPKGEEIEVGFTKGRKISEELVVYYPRNSFIRSLEGEDSQSETPNPVFGL